MVLISHIVPYASIVGDSFHMMHGNSKPDTDRQMENMFETELVYSPDLNAIQKAWNTL